MPAFTFTSDDLDSWLAVNVMGWTPTTIVEDVEEGHHIPAWDADGEIESAHNWSPSTHLMQAVRCAEKARSTGRIRNWTLGVSSQDIPFAEIYEMRVTSATAERALCRVLKEQLS